MKLISFVIAGLFAFFYALAGEFREAFSANRHRRQRIAAQSLSPGYNTWIKGLLLRLEITAKPKVLLTAFLMQDGKVRSEEHILGGARSIDNYGAVWVQNSEVYLNLSLIPPSIERIILVLSLEKPSETFQNVALQMILHDIVANEPLVTYQSDGKSKTTERAVILSEIYRRPLMSAEFEWKFKAVDLGWTSGLPGACNSLVSSDCR